MILEVGCSAKREKPITTTANYNNRIINEINTMDEPNHKDIGRMEQYDDNEEE